MASAWKFLILTEGKRGLSVNPSVLAKDPSRHQLHVVCSFLVATQLPHYLPSSQFFVQTYSRIHSTLSLKPYGPVSLSCAMSWFWVEFITGGPAQHSLCTDNTKDNQCSFKKILAWSLLNFYGVGGWALRFEGGEELGRTNAWLVYFFFCSHE